MNNLILWIQHALERIEDLDLSSKLRFFRRYSRRKILVLSIISFVVLYYLFSGEGNENVSVAQQCLNDRLRVWSQQFDDLDLGIDHSSVNFVGNGYVGVDSNGHLRISSNGSRALDVSSGFIPFVQIDIDGAQEFAESLVTDFKNGILRKIMCFSVNNECACVLRSFFVHRTRSNIIVEDFQVINPTKSSFTVNVNRPSSTNEWKSNKTGDATVWFRDYSLNSQKKNVVSVICSNAPGSVTVLQKREENYRFVCVVSQNEISAETNFEEAHSPLFSNIIAQFSSVNTESSSVLDSEHMVAWNKISSPSFFLSHSKAPNVLNGDKINATRYILLSNSRALTLERGQTDEISKSMIDLSRKNERCYTGHSTLLYPSRLWQNWDLPEDLVKIADVWLLTLEKRGCANFIKTGSEGIAKAFVLSLMACSFHDGHLEMEMAASDLHREMGVFGVPVGPSGATVSVKVVIPSDNKPYLDVSSSGDLFACDGGCLDEPVTLAKNFARLPVKVTKPQTSILYIATNRKHLEQLKSAIHVSEVGAAPAHEEDVLSMHRHGSRWGGLPTSFWVFLGVILIAFHVFLAKLLWSEWRRGDMTPYNPYLRNRYSYVRSH